MTPKIINGKPYSLHHTAMTRGYISRKNEPAPTPYSGKFGKGFVIYRPNWESTRFSFVDYYIETVGVTV